MYIQGYASGRVQRVGFRNFVQETATKFGLTGYVRNLSDGRVEFVLQGEQTQIDNALERIKIGPSYAKVESIDCSQPAEHGDEVFRDFSIRY
ncbi:Acylphosphatase [Thalassocella blandensis]|nr:Acylphosphatase [Thalassocella blandensis]